MLMTGPFLLTQHNSFMQTSLDLITEAYRSLVLFIKIKKTKIYQPALGNNEGPPPDIKIS